MSIEEIQRLKEKIGLKLYNKAVTGGAKEKKKASTSKQDFKRENKVTLPIMLLIYRVSNPVSKQNRPREMSSKKPVARFRDVVGVSSEQNAKVAGRRDPRFDSLCGEFDNKVSLP